MAKNFVAAVKFFEDVARLAEEANHHPDLHLTGYRNVEVSPIVVPQLAFNQASIDKLEHAKHLCHVLLASPRPKPITGRALFAWYVNMP